MADRIETLNVDKLLTSLVRGYRNTELIGEMVFPPVAVESETGKIPSFGKESFMLYETVRGLRADSNERDVALFSSISYETNEHDLSARIDYREEQRAFLNLQQHESNVNMQNIKLAHEKACADLAFAASTFGSDNKDTLTDEFLNEDLVDPIKSIRVYMDNLEAIIGVRPTHLIMGRVVWANMQDNAKLLERIKYSQAGIVGIDLLKSALDLKEVLIGRAKYLENIGDSLSDVWGNYLLLLYNPSPSGLAASVFEPSFGYTLRLKGHPFVDKGIDKGKIPWVRTTDNYAVKVVGAESGYLVSNPIDPDVLT